MAVKGSSLKISRCRQISIPVRLYQRLLELKSRLSHPRESVWRGGTYRLRLARRWQSHGRELCWRCRCTFPRRSLLHQWLSDCRSPGRIWKRQTQLHGVCSTVRTAVPKSRKKPHKSHLSSSGSSSSSLSQIVVGTSVESCFTLHSNTTDFPLWMTLSSRCLSKRVGSGGGSEGFTLTPVVVSSKLLPSIAYVI